MFIDREDVSIRMGDDHMVAKRDYYEGLGVQKNADDSTIKKAYRTLAKKYHPDTNAGDEQAAERFKEVTEAYNVLSDPEKRKMYDRFGHAAFDGMGGGASGGNPFSGGSYGGYGAGQNGPFRGTYREGSDGSRTYYYSSSDPGMDDVFGDIFGDMFGDTFREKGSYGGFGNRGNSRQGSGFGSRGGYQRDGGDLNAEISVSFDEAVYGCDKVIRLQSQDSSGKIRSLQVHVPAGIDSGQSIRLRGQGMPGSDGGAAGDLLLKVNVGQRAGFEREGMDVYTTVRVPFSTAVLGGEVRVQTLYGDVLCKVAEGTQSGSRIRLRNKGIVSMKNPQEYGDQYVTVEVEVPKNLSPDAKQKLKEFEQACGRKQRGRGAA